MTANRSTGVEVPTSNRSDESLARARRDVAETAHGSIPPIADAIRRSIAAFRRGDVDAGNGEMTQALSTLRTLALATGMLGLTPTFTASRLPEVDAMFVRLSRVLDELEARQRCNDWTGIADALDHDLLPVLLLQWPTLLLTVFGPAPVSAPPSPDGDPGRGDLVHAESVAASAR